MGYALSGKTALVTGANRGIGEAIVDALVAAGVKKVYTAARNISTLGPLVDRHGSRVVPLQLDVTNAAQIAAAAATATDADLLVNNAGIVGFHGGDFTDPKWIEGGRQEMEVNFLGTFAVTQAFAPAYSRGMAAAPSPTSTRWPRSSASRFSRRTAPRRPRHTRSLRSRVRCCGGRTRRCLACIPGRLTPRWARC